MGYLVVFLTGAFLGALTVIMWALVAAAKRDRDDKNKRSL